MQIHCVQLDIVWEDKPANHEKVRRLLADAKPQPGSLILLPEMFSTGFSMNVATVADDSRTDHSFLSNLAREHRTYVVGGLVTTGPEGKGRNQALVFDPQGSEILRYTKLHSFTPGKEAQHYRQGDQIGIFDWLGMKTCPFICYDLRFPEIFRLGTRQGAQLFPLIANWPLMREDHWVTLCRARAIENQAYVAAVNRSGNDPWLPYPGRSLIVDPHGVVLADAGRSEQVISAELDPQEVNEWRTQFPILKDMRDDFISF
ncbi:MAG: carbon-nitrogen family hydrolase [Gemmatimonadaceae bacterium]|nr:carbon-nitrogen family hydrolase [Gemmatimonadaceae bacterium]